jgi:ABC-type Fe3+ transport system permease subunit
MKKKRWIVMWIVLAAILIVTAAPLISVIVAGSIAEANGCTLHEGFVNPCIINGRDVGQTLYTMGMMGWLMLASIPLGGIALVVWLVLAVVLALSGRHPSPPPAGTI